MSLRRTILNFAAPAALLMLGACAQPFRADVARFQMMPPPQGQTFAIQPADPRLQGGIEFAQYAQLVSDRLSAEGYRPAQGGPPNFVVTLDYGVDNGHEKVVSTPGFAGGYGPGWGYGGFGYGGLGYGRFGGWRGRFSYGWADPFWYQGYGYPEVSSYTYYVSRLDMKIRDARDGRMLFEGRAKARSLDDALPHLVPNLIEAMFVGFPGRSGEEMMITIPPPPKNGAPPPRPSAEPRERL